MLPGDVGPHTVASVLASRTVAGSLEYFVKWDGFGHASNTWEPASNLSGAQEAIQYFLGMREEEGMSNFLGVVGTGMLLWEAALPDINHVDFVCMHPGSRLAKRQRAKEIEFNKLSLLPKGGVAMTVPNNWYQLSEQEAAASQNFLSETVGITAAIAGILIMVQHNSAGDHVAVCTRFLMRDLTLLDGSGLAVFEAAYSSKESDVSIVVCKTLLGTHDRIGITQKVQAPVALALWYAEITRIISCRVKAGLPVSSTGVSATVPFATADDVCGDVGLSNLVGVDPSGCKVYQSCTVLDSEGMAMKLESGRDAIILTKEHGEEIPNPAWHQCLRG